jgi:hypothetical protein
MGGAAPRVLAVGVMRSALDVHGSLLHPDHPRPLRPSVPCNEAEAAGLLVASLGAREHPGAVRAGPPVPRRVASRKPKLATMPPIQRVRAVALEPDDHRPGNWWVAVELSEVPPPGWAELWTKRAYDERPPLVLVCDAARIKLSASRCDMSHRVRYVDSLLHVVNNRYEKSEKRIAAYQETRRAARAHEARDRAEIQAELDHF